MSDNGKPCANKHNGCSELVYERGNIFCINCIQQRKKSSVSSTSNDLIDKIRSLEARLSNLQGENNRILHELEDTKQLLSISKIQCEEHKIKSSSKFSEDLNRNQEYIEQLEKHNNKLQIKYEQLESEFIDLTKEKNLLSFRLDELKIENDTLLLENKRLAYIIGGLNENSVSQHDISDVSDKNTKLLDEVERLKDKIELMEHLNETKNSSPKVSVGRKSPNITQELPTPINIDSGRRSPSRNSPVVITPNSRNNSPSRKVLPNLHKYVDDSDREKPKKLPPKQTPTSIKNLIESEKEQERDKVDAFKKSVEDASNVKSEKGKKNF